MQYKAEHIRAATEPLRNFRGYLRRCTICNAKLMVYAHPTLATLVFNSACNCSGGDNERVATWDQIMMALDNQENDEREIVCTKP